MVHLNDLKMMRKIIRSDSILCDYFEFYIDKKVVIGYMMCSDTNR